MVSICNQSYRIYDVPVVKSTLRKLLNNQYSISPAAQILAEND